jgi:signal transduction histidine kinase
MKIKKFPLKLPSLSLRSRIILSMASMVLITALACFVICVMVIDQRTRELESRLQSVQLTLPIPPDANITLDRIKKVINNSADPNEQLAQIRGMVRGNEFVSFDILQQVLYESGFPVVRYSRSGRPPHEANQAPKPGYGDVIGGSPGVYYAVPATPVEGAGKLWFYDAALTSSTISKPLPANMVKLVSKASDDFITKAFTVPLYNSMIIGSSISVLVAVVFGFFLSLTVIRPLRKLEQASERIADGNYTLELKKEGDDDLGRLARSFNKMSRALRQTEQKRKDLVADVSHELRTPLSSIQGYTEALRDGLIKSQDRVNDIYDHILKEVKHLTGMVNALRSWVSTEQALERLSPESFKVKPAVDSIINRFEPAANSKKVTLNVEYHTERDIWADVEAFSHVLSNLIDNALRYTPANGTITVKAHSPKQKYVWFEVSDSGSGISEEHLPFVFERFYRVDKSRSSETGGTGLGLAIVRDSVLTMGGDVKINSKVNEGTTVGFSLPIYQPQKRETKLLKRELAGV